MGAGGIASSSSAARSGAIPGSGYFNEFIAPGVTPTDPNRAVFKFLVVGNQLWIGATVRDSSIGGNAEFNRSTACS